jgi:hypothetical protein
LRETWKHRNNVSAFDALYLAVAKLYDAPLLTRTVPCPGLLAWESPCRTFADRAIMTIQAERTESEAAAIRPGGLRPRLREKLPELLLEAIETELRNTRTTTARCCERSKRPCPG